MAGAIPAQVGSLESAGQAAQLSWSDLHLQGWPHPELMLLQLRPSLLTPLPLQEPKNGPKPQHSSLGGYSGHLDKFSDIPSMCNYSSVNGREGFKPTLNLMLESKICLHIKALNFQSAS